MRVDRKIKPDRSVSMKEKINTAFNSEQNRLIKYIMDIYQYTAYFCINEIIISDLFRKFTVRTDKSVLATNTNTTTACTTASAVTNAYWKSIVDCIWVHRKTTHYRCEKCANVHLMDISMERRSGLFTVDR